IQKDMACFRIFSPSTRNSKVSELYKRGISISDLFLSAQLSIFSFARLLRPVSSTHEREYHDGQWHREMVQLDQGLRLHRARGGLQGRLRPCDRPGARWLA